MKRVFLFLAGANQPHLPDQMAASGVSGRIGQGLSKLFISPPPLDKRIAALKRSL